MTYSDMQFGFCNRLGVGSCSNPSSYTKPIVRGQTMTSNTIFGTTSQIKPIETEYKGYRFRSRLEARWAVFFDAIKLKYEYEQEGYCLGNSCYYLPDFTFPTLKIHCEIKPSDAAIDYKLYGRFRDNITPILVIHGPPWEYIATWFGWDLCDSGGGAGEFDAAICSNLREGFQYIILDDWRSDRCFGIDSIFTEAISTQSTASFPIKDMGVLKYSNKMAISKSKRARFEHGESP